MLRLKHLLPLLLLPLQLLPLTLHRHPLLPHPLWHPPPRSARPLTAAGCNSCWPLTRNR